MESLLQKDLEDAVANVLDKPVHFPIKGSRNLPSRELPKTASDQLATAIAGLITVEAEFIQFARELVGEIKDEAETPKLRPSENGPIIPRMRSDAELIARMAIRLHNRIEEVRSLL